ncbi:MAG: DUF362 domain-containing protein, partial [Candidatus Lokiarchaeota archaeon]|nr:DUF362 domain-containing protein [Candidatus Lokiarchaeota archaeon]MBD3339523.1 DUF362 domain-containing protein [Candidatus Lokiarchaeota archaeon]
MLPKKRFVVTVAKNEKIELAVDKALSKLDLPDLSGLRILLKPNVGRETNPKQAINTNPDVVEAVFRYLHDRFDADFYIGDSPIINTDSRKSFLTSGYENVLNQEDLVFLDLDEKPPVELSIFNGRILKKVKVTGYWNEFDYIVSIPVLKMHMHTGASLSFKNSKGLIYKREKIKLHHQYAPQIIQDLESTLFQDSKTQIKELDVAIADLALCIKPDLSIIDASYVLEGMGPASGNPVKLDTIIASKNFLATDIVALKLVQPNWTLDNV